ncbi:MAG: hypothetical protein WEG36_06135 [Gemmatimonadota bacterium]
MAELLQCVVQMSVELVDAVGPAVGEGRLGKAPDAFVGIELGGVGRQRDQVQATVASAQLSHGGSSMDGGVVPDDDDVAAQVTEQVTQEIAHAVAVDVVAMEAVVESHRRRTGLIESPEITEMRSRR